MAVWGHSMKRNLNKNEPYRSHGWGTSKMIKTTSMSFKNPTTWQIIKCLSLFTSPLASSKKVSHIKVKNLIPSSEGEKKKVLTESWIKSVFVDQIVSYGLCWVQSKSRSRGTPGRPLAKYNSNKQDEKSWMRNDLTGFNLTATSTTTDGKWMEGEERE